MAVASPAALKWRTLEQVKSEIRDCARRVVRGRAAAITSHPLPCDDVGAEHDCGVSSGEQVVNDLRQRARTPHRTGRDPYRDLMTHIIGID